MPDFGFLWTPGYLVLAAFAAIAAAMWWQRRNKRPLRVSPRAQDSARDGQSAPPLTPNGSRAQRSQDIERVPTAELLAFLSKLDLLAVCPILLRNNVTRPDHLIGWGVQHLTSVGIRQEHAALIADCAQKRFVQSGASFVPIIALMFEFTVRPAFQKRSKLRDSVMQPSNAVSYEGLPEPRGFLMKKSKSVIKVRKNSK